MARPASVRSLLVAIVLFWLVPLPGLAGTESQPEMWDAPNDVSRSDGAAVSAPFAEALDFRSVWLTQDPVGVHWMHIQVTSLTGLTPQSLGQDGYANYAVVYDARDERSYQVSASFDLTGTWTCSSRDLTADETEDPMNGWSRVPGYVDVANSVMHIRIPSLPEEATPLGAATSPNMRGQSWGARNHEESQSVDWMRAAVTRVLGDTIPVEPAPTEGVWCGSPLDVNLVQDGSAVIADPAGDVMRDGATVDDELAQAMDILENTFTVDAQGRFWVHVDMADLSRVQKLTQQDDVSLQYATGFGRAGGDREFQLSFVTGGATYAHNPGTWRCEMYDYATDEWQEVYGFVDQQNGMFHAMWPAVAQAILGSGQRIAHVGAAAWASYGSDLPQTNDWAYHLGYFVGTELTPKDAVSGEGMTPCPGNGPAEKEVETKVEPRPIQPASSTHGPTSAMAVHQGPEGAPGVVVPAGRGAPGFELILLVTALGWVVVRRRHRVS